LAAAMACEGKRSPREVDIELLQSRLAEIGNLSPEVPSHDEGPALSKEDLQTAVHALGAGKTEDVAFLFAEPERAVPLLRKAHTGASSSEERLRYAKALALLGDNSGLDDLLREIESYETWDQGWDYRSGGQFGSNMSVLDGLVFAVARTADPGALPVLLEKLSLLGADDAFSHHRAISVALESIGDPKAAPALAGLLSSPGIRGHAVTDI